MMERLLMIHQGTLGDVVLSFPALERLKTHSGIRMDLLCRNQIGKVANALGVVDACFDVDGACFSGLFEKRHDSKLALFFDRYDAVVLVGFSSLMEQVVGRYMDGKVFRMPPRPSVEERIHVARHFVAELEKSGFFDCFGRPLDDPFLSQKRLSPLCQETSAEDPFFVVHPGAGSRRKRWDLQRFMDVAAWLGSERGKVVFLLGPAERDLLPHLMTGAKQKRFSIETTDELATVIELLRKARCFVGNDSGVSHLAGYMGTPTISIFGPTDPTRWAPVGPRVKILRAEATCPPCFERADANCEAQPCLAQVTVDMVLAAAQSFV